MNKILFTAIMFSTFIGFAQHKKAIDLYNKGVKAFSQNEIKAADSLFELSASLEPNKDTYYNLAMTKNKLGDFCGFCDNLEKAIRFLDLQAYGLYYLHCFRKDTLFYNKSKDSSCSYFRITSKHKCTDTSSASYYKLYSDHSVSTIRILPDSAIKYTKEDFDSPNFDIERISEVREVFTVCEVQPDFIGGENALRSFLAQNITYPQEAKENGISGTVFITFIIDPEGNIIEPIILRGVGGGCDEEALRVIMLMPKWSPGKQGGKAVYTQFNLPVRFVLDH